MMALIFILLCGSFTNTGNTSFILYEPQHVNETDFVYSGNKVIEADNFYNDHTITRETLQFPTEIKSFLIDTYGLLMIVALFFAIDEILEGMYGKGILSRIRRK